MVVLNFKLIDGGLFMSNNDQNSQVLSLLQTLVTEVNTLTNDLHEIKLTRYNLDNAMQEVRTEMQEVNLRLSSLDSGIQEVKAEMQEVKTEVQEVKTEMREVKLRVSSLENNMVYFGTRLQTLEDKVDAVDEKIESRLYDTRPIWQSVLERLDKLEREVQEFRVEVLDRLDFLEKDFRGYKRDQQRQIASILTELSLNDERVEKIQAKLEIKN